MDGRVVTRHHRVARDRVPLRVVLKKFQSSWWPACPRVVRTASRKRGERRLCRCRSLSTSRRRPAAGPPRCESRNRRATPAPRAYSWPWSDCVVRTSGRTRWRRRRGARQPYESRRARRGGVACRSGQRGPLPELLLLLVGPLKTPACCLHFAGKGGEKIEDGVGDDECRRRL